MWTKEEGGQNADLPFELKKVVNSSLIKHGSCDVIKRHFKHKFKEGAWSSVDSDSQIRVKHIFWRIQKPAAIHMNSVSTVKDRASVTPLLN